MRLALKGLRKTNQHVLKKHRHTIQNWTLPPSIICGDNGPTGDEFSSGGGGGSCGGGGGMNNGGGLPSNRISESVSWSFNWFEVFLSTDILADWSKFILPIETGELGIDVSALETLSGADIDECISTECSEVVDDIDGDLFGIVGAAGALRFPLGDGTLFSSSFSLSKEDCLLKGFCTPGGFGAFRFDFLSNVVSLSNSEVPKEFVWSDGAGLIIAWSWPASVFKSSANWGDIFWSEILMLCNYCRYCRVSYESKHNAYLVLTDMLNIAFTILI